MNVCSFAPQTAEDLKKQNWHRLDCLTAHQLRNERDNKKLMEWFSKQDAEWQKSRKERIQQRLRSRNFNY